MAVECGMPIGRNPKAGVRFGDDGVADETQVVVVGYHRPAQFQ